MAYSTEEIVAAYMANGQSQRATSRVLNMAVSTVQYHLDKAGLRGAVAQLAAEVKPEALTQELILADKVKQLEAQLALFKRETLDDHYVKTKILGIKEEFDQLAPPIWLTTPSSSGHSLSVPTLLLSDLHWGEVVDAKQVSGINEYNIGIANRRLDTVIEKAVMLLREHIAGVDYPGFVLCLGGDLLAGDIHDELKETNDGPTFPALLNLLSALISKIEFLADEFDYVYVPCVAGNHGRTTRKPRAKHRNETNLDWLLYQFLALHFQGDSRVVIDAPTSPELTYKVFNHTYHLCHGDQLGKGGDGIIGSFGPIIRGDHKRRSLQSQLNKPYNTMIHGHYHTYAATQRFISNGSLVGYDEYAMACGFGYEIPQQAFWLTHAEHGITFSMPVHAEEPKKVAPAKWVSFEERT
ncbi:helix-turn-helix transcriptional regulator [Ferribacterium limneticum]|uniref:helix-turn-helix transcriptional regulator n=1 Tax=Ferribacterium limneticum TaxID=76259 RepID=UPI001CF85046|nr:hypothetical protein [Ferribacterium limneticum]UCV26787.1 hypothetical protein KI617_10740 [Ferribacterium limneticum]UCV30704.1 hypothetical protein KI608_10740 [Ferribacterium limneticum]